MVLYEYPFNESIRTMLRLEHLFDRLGQLIPRDAAVDHHYALATMFEIMDVASRADLKSDLLKELERHKAQLNSYRGNPSISEQALDEITARIDHAFNGLNQLPGKAGHQVAGTHNRTFVKLSDDTARARWRARRLPWATLLPPRDTAQRWRRRRWSGCNGRSMPSPGAMRRPGPSSADQRWRLFR